LSPARPRAVGADLGSTAIKAGILDEHGRLIHVESVAAPPLVGTGNVREGDAEAYAAAVAGLLRSVSGRVPRGTPLGLATQRSSFTLWDRLDGRPRFPLISWQDRRAASWCDRHRGLEPEVLRRTGLALSAHYVGPKLAAMQEEDPTFRLALHDGAHVLGTLETYLLWQWSAGRRHESDVTVAARTAMLDLAAGDWSSDLLERFGVPAMLLPSVVSTAREAIPLDNGLCLTATLSDQAAAALAVFDPCCSSALVNLGTGAFVLRPVDDTGIRRPGYLLAPILATGQGSVRYALEGTVNGAGPAVDGCGPGPTDLAEIDPTPEGYAIPDRAGLGSPYWRPEIGLTLSSGAEELPAEDRRRIVLEGLLFRVRQILEDLCEDGLPERIVLAGGLLRDPAVAPGLAALLGRPVEVLLERESGLLGASRLAAGLDPHAASTTAIVEPGRCGRYLPEKFGDWLDWLEQLLSR
jgi:glycerol kinase